jgi:predicted nucleotidyltransferase component of viral defense system
MIPQRDLSRISNALVKQGGKRIQEAVIERDYCLAWFLTCLGGHRLRAFLAFKGGTALRRCWIEHYRFSEDLDFTLVQPIELKDILAGLDEIFAEMKARTAIEMAFDREDRHGHLNTHTFYLGYKAQLPARSDVKVDITIKEALCFPLVDRPILRTYAEFADLPEGPTVQTYSLQEIFIEKLAALSDKARTEPRDLYDLWRLIDPAAIRAGELKGELAAKLAIRDRKPDGVGAAIDAKEARLKKLWETRLSRQVADLPGFDDVFRSFMRVVRDADFG